MTSIPPSMPHPELTDLLERQRQAFLDEGPVHAATRVDRLNRCIALIVDHQQELCEAVNADFGGRSRHVTLMTDLYTSVSTLKFARKNLRRWMRPQRRRSPAPLGLLGARARVHYQPKGVVGIMTPWNVPVNMVFSPLADVLAAGNRALIKPSEFTAHTSELLQRLFQRYFEDTEIAVVTGGPEVAAAFSALPLDHLIFTGATSIGRKVMEAASKNLVPVTLELGGKSPVIVSETADIHQAADKLATGKAMNAGQLCIAPDYVFVPASRMESFINAFRQSATALYPRVVDNPDYVAMINERHFDRIRSYLDEAEEQGSRVLAAHAADENWREAREQKKIPLHLVIDPGEELRCMQDEIFGPLLNVIGYREVDQCIDFINRRPRPLALYYFGWDQAEQARVIDHTLSGGVTINDVALHFACDDLPFGGVGPSGMGHYHGFEGFKTFSHARAVFRQARIDVMKLAGTRPPYSERVDKMMAQQIRK